MKNIYKKKQKFTNKIFFIQVILLGLFLTSCSHLYFDKIQPKGGKLQSEIPFQIQGNYSKWCYSNSEGSEVCYDEKDVISIDTIALRSLIANDTNLLSSMFFKIDSKTIEIKSFIFDEINGIHRLNEDVFVSRIKNFFILNFKVDSKKYTKLNGKTLEADLYECFAFEVDSSGITQIFLIDSSIPFLNKTNKIIPSGSGDVSYISKKALTKRNLAKAIYSHPLRYILLNKDKGSVNRIELNKEAGIDCGESKSMGLKYRMRKVKKSESKENTELKPLKF